MNETERCESEESLHSESPRSTGSYEGIFRKSSYFSRFDIDDLMLSIFIEVKEEEYK